MLLAFYNKQDGLLHQKCIRSKMSIVLRLKNHGLEEDKLYQTVGER